MRETASPAHAKTVMIQTMSEESDDFFTIVNHIITKSLTGEAHPQHLTLPQLPLTAPELVGECAAHITTFYITAYNIAMFTGFVRKLDTVTYNLFVALLGLGVETQALAYDMNCSADRASATTTLVWTLLENTKLISPTHAAIAKAFTAPSKADIKGKNTQMNV